MLSPPGRGQGRLTKPSKRDTLNLSSAVDMDSEEGHSALASSKWISVEEAERNVWTAIHWPYAPRWTGTRPHTQEQSPLLTLPAEIVDRILGDQVLNERDHLALSGTCTAIRMGYSDAFWEATLKLHTPFSHNQFTYSLLSDPCNIRAARTIFPEPSPLPPRCKLWSTALGNIRAYRNSIFSASYASVTFSGSDPPIIKPGIDFYTPCYKPKHKKCQCLRAMGPSHAKVISNVNLRKTSWGHIFYHYQSLSEQVSHTSFESVTRINTRGKETEMFNLAAVDAAILRTLGGVYRAMNIRDEDAKRGRRRKAPKDRDW
ncbi:hypothetical protein K435DRAFT_395810 [Dendrothele bispora CBS 962.96]|uniref:Uncharacterized protein n=1 Tax=Dendrothele bispora (strain CBS 962.96) TaxID=1314807 RepID=A0A4S8L8A5_DENBC|nr:hypothetical protein K435DRAFT_395810 [Dendrothele bispora CBS 962.96]